MLLHFTNPLCQKKMVTYKIKRQDIIKLRSYVTLFWFVDMNIILISFSPMDLNFKCLGYNLTSNFYFERIYKVFTASIYIKKKPKTKPETSEEVG